MYVPSKIFLRHQVMHFFRKHSTVNCAHGIDLKIVWLHRKPIYIELFQKYMLDFNGFFSSHQGRHSSSEGGPRSKMSECDLEPRSWRSTFKLPLVTPRKSFNKCTTFYFCMPHLFTFWKPFMHFNSFSNK